MNHVIRLLPDAIANQIAAGEVVQRPASVVKELLENAIDAGATSISLLIKEGGKTLIQVIDNGSGMSEADARMSFERHATSKIKAFDDMLSLKTFGFRGEALASIAAVAQVEMKTRMANAEVGTQLRIEGSEFKSQDLVAADVGTSITVKNLFFNVPARRNFLKSNQVEFSHISDELNRVALAWPEVGFSFYQGGVLLQKLPAGTLAQRIVALFGENVREKIVSISEETDFLKVAGYIGKPEAARKTRGEQYFFANRRYIRNAYLHHAVMTAFEGLLAQASFPFYILNLELDPEKIDINVHPTKTEIKFENERFVYSVVQAAVRKALHKTLAVPELDFEPPSPWLATLSSPPTQRSPVFTPTSRPDTVGKSNLDNWTRMFSNQAVSPKQRIQQFETERSGDQPLPAQSDPLEEKINAPDRPGLFNLHGKYLLAQVKSGFMAIDLQRAWERIGYERYINQINHQNASSQQLLFPKSIELSASDFALVQEMDAEIRALGIDWEPFGGTTLLLRGMPSDAAQQDPVLLFQHFLEQYKWNQTHLQVPRSHSVARALAKRNAQQQQFHYWKDAELNDLVHQLFACTVPQFAPDQQPVLKVITLEEVAGWLV